MAFYATRGITPKEIRQMSYEDIAILIAGQRAYYDDEIKVTEAALLNVLGRLVSDKDG